MGLVPCLTLGACAQPAKTLTTETAEVETTPAEDAEATETGSGDEAAAEVEETPPAEEAADNAIFEEGYTVRDLEFSRDGKKIFGKLYMPNGKGPHPLAIMGHGYGANLSMMEGYAKSFAEHGIAGYAFDFIGGGGNIRSDGVTTEMSVLTEADDMIAVLDGMRDVEGIDADNIFLMGGSQGGFVATYAAAKRPADVKALIALYPAYVLQDDAKMRTNNGTAIRDVTNVMGVDIGRIYDEDALSFDIYDVMKDYTGPTLIIHGTVDNVVPYSYSERAAEIMPSAKIIKIEGAGHVFFGADDEYATKCCLEFADEVLGR